MKILRFNHLKNESTPHPRTGLLIAGDTIADLRVGYAKYLTEKMRDPQGREIAALRIAPNIVSMISLGKAGREAMEPSAGYLTDLYKSDPEAKGAIGEPLFLRYAECKLHAPIRPAKIIAFGKQAAPNAKGPLLSIKGNNGINSPFRDIVMPASLKQLRCETKLAVVLGKRCKNITPAQADDVVFGYMMAHDVSVGDDANSDNLHDTFLPTGPWVVTKDEIKDPMNLEIKASVNGKSMRVSNTKDMPLSISELIAYASTIMKLEPGDLILTGTPSNADSAVVPLQLGDVLDTEIEGIAKLRNKVGNDPSK